MAESLRERFPYLWQKPRVAPLDAQPVKYWLTEFRPKHGEMTRKTYFKDGSMMVEILPFRGGINQDITSF